MGHAITTLRIWRSKEQTPADGRTIEVSVPDLKPTWCMEIKYSLKTATGKSINNTIRATIHNLTN